MNDKINIASAFKHLAPQQLGEGVGTGFSLIGFKGKVWSLRHKGETHYFTRDDDGTPLPYIDVVILGENPNISKTYYPQGTYTEDSANQPTCSSLNGDVPDPGVPIPQSPTCGTCKRDQWTILQTGQKGKECKDNKRVAVLLMPAMTEKMLDEPLLDPVMLRIPPASLRPLKAYGDSLIHRGAHPAAVVTRITFERDRQFQMKFDLKQPLTNAEAPVIMDLLENSQTQIILGKQAVIREIEHQPRREETGIATAFGKTVQNEPARLNVTPVKVRGRPPGSVNKPKPPVIEPDGSPDEPMAAQQEPTQASLPLTVGAVHPVPWEEADGELDDTLRKVVDQKIQGMLK